MSWAPIQSLDLPPWQQQKLYLGHKYPWLEITALLDCLFCWIDCPRSYCAKRSQNLSKLSVKWSFSTVVISDLSYLGMPKSLGLLQKASPWMLIRHTQCQHQVSHQWALHLLYIPFSIQSFFLSLHPSVAFLFHVSFWLSPRCHCLSHSNSCLPFNYFLSPCTAYHIVSPHISFFWCLFSTVRLWCPPFSLHSLCFLSL